MFRSSKGIKRATVVTVPVPINIGAMAEAVDKLKFRELTKNQQETWGFIPPQDDGDWKLVESVRQYHILTLRYDHRVLNKSRLSRKWHDAIREKEKKEERKLTKEERQELRDSVMKSMFAETGPREHIYQGVYDSEKDRLIVLESSTSSVQFFVEKLNRALEGQESTVQYSAKQPEATIEDVLTSWVLMPSKIDANEHPFEVGTSMRLEDASSKAVLSNQDPDTEEVRAHLHNRKFAQQVKLTWKDEVQFALSSKRSLSQIDFKRYCAQGQKEAQEEAREDIRAYEQATFLVYMGAFEELWASVEALPCD